MSLKNFLKPIDLVSYDTDNNDTTYKVLIASLGKACSFIRIVNNSDKDITVSYDGGISDHEFIPTKTALNLYAQAINQPSSFVSLIAKGTAISIKGAKGTGSVYLSGWYSPVNP